MALLWQAHLEGDNLVKAHLEGKSMPVVDLERIRKGKGDFPEKLKPAELIGVFLDAGTSISDITFGDQEHGFVKLYGVRWDNVDLGEVDWKKVTMLGDESEARNPKKLNGALKNKDDRFKDYQVAVQANRQLAVALQ